MQNAMMSELAAFAVSTGQARPVHQAGHPRGASGAPAQGEGDWAAVFASASAQRVVAPPDAAGAPRVAEPEVVDAPEDPGPEDGADDLAGATPLEPSLLEAEEAEGALEAADAPFAPEGEDLVPEPAPTGLLPTPPQVAPQPGTEAATTGDVAPAAAGAAEALGRSRDGPLPDNSLRPPAPELGEMPGRQQDPRARAEAGRAPQAVIQGQAVAGAPEPPAAPKTGMRDGGASPTLAPPVVRDGRPVPEQEDPPLRFVEADPARAPAAEGQALPPDKAAPGPMLPRSDAGLRTDRAQTVKRAGIREMAPPEARPRPPTHALETAREAEPAPAQGAAAATSPAPTPPRAAAIVPMPEAEVAAIQGVTEPRGATVAPQAAGPAAPPGQTAVAQQVAVQIGQIARPLPDGPIELSLHPEELGRLKLSFSGAEAGLHVVIAAERPETLDLLRRHIDVLAQEMRRLGAEGAQFSFLGGNATFADRHRGSGAQGRSLGWAGDGSPGSPAPMEATAPRPMLRLGDAGLDLRL
ncbi:flagellar hook-length control protein FliK [Vannielia litorea]|uniref:Hook-length control protein FliK n=1 Tax=Vannielia litorea TaxID=1217970 RepID=A0A1N6H096_9RHOB|nr:flagellar hook-length control protein FliK [Vannielia litorea]SIO13176.1 hook-length control protein FliK [Vannielia litorea]